MKKLKLLLVALVAILVVPFSVFAEGEETTATEESNEVKVYIFHGETCPHCKEALEWFAEIEEEHGNKFELVKYEVWNDSKNAALMEKVASTRGEKADGVPYIIVGDQSWNGFTSELAEAILSKINSEYKVEPSERYDIMKLVNKPKEAEKINYGQETLKLLVIAAVLGIFVGGILFARKGN